MKRKKSCEWAHQLSYCSTTCIYLIYKYIYIIIYIYIYIYRIQPGETYYFFLFCWLLNEISHQHSSIQNWIFKLNTRTRIFERNITGNYSKIIIIIQGALIRSGQKTFFCKSGRARKLWRALIGRATKKTKLLIFLTRPYKRPCIRGCDCKEPQTRVRKESFLAENCVIWLFGVPLSNYKKKWLQ